MLDRKIPLRVLFTLRHKNNVFPFLFLACVQKNKNIAFLCTYDLRVIYFFFITFFLFFFSLCVCGVCVSLSPLKNAGRHK